SLIPLRMQAVVKLSKHQVRNNLNREDLALMNVSGKMQADAGRLCRLDLSGAVVKQDRRLGGVETRQPGYLFGKTQLVPAFRIADSDHLQAVDDHPFIVH